MKQQNFRLVKIESICRENEGNLNIEICSKNGKKIFWEKEKMLVTSIFPFFHNAFKAFFLTVIKSGDCGVTFLIHDRPCSGGSVVSVSDS